MVLAALAAQEISVQPRDARPTAARPGGAAIRGRVYSAETGAPIRRASVTLMVLATSVEPAGSVPSRPQTTATDASGRFEFLGLSSGAYRLRVAPPSHTGQYLPGVYGAGTDVTDSGRTIELKDGEQFAEADVALRRGGAIVGRIVDDSGEPLTRVTVYPSRILPGSGSSQRSGAGIVQTDDLGRYRIYGLEPGDYIVSAEARGMGGPPTDTVESEGYLTTFHPSTANEREASRVRVRAAADTDGVDIQVIRTRTFRITGTVTDSQGRLIARPNGQLVKQQGGGSMSASGFSVDAQGRFTIRDVVPGDYTLVVRPTGSFDVAVPESRPANREYASVPLTVASDIDNVVVVTQPGVTIAGEIVFSDGQPGGAAGTIRVTTQPSNRMLMVGPLPSATPGADNRFTLSDLFGPQLVRVSLTRRDWALKAITLGATDITDLPVEFKKEHSGHLRIEVTTRAAMIEGVVTGDDGAPVEQAMILIFPEDSQSWRFGSPRVRMVTSMKDGRYTAGGLVAGRYFALAAPFRSMAMTPDTPPEFFESLARDATRLVVAADERRVVDLRLTKRAE